MVRNNSEEGWNWRLKKKGGKLEKITLGRGTRTGRGKGKKVIC